MRKVKWHQACAVAKKSSERTTARNYKINSVQVLASALLDIDSGQPEVVYCSICCLLFLLHRRAQPQHAAGSGTLDAKVGKQRLWNFTVSSQELGQN